MQTVKAYQLRIAVASLLVVALSVPIGLYALTQQTRYTSKAVDTTPLSLNPRSTHPPITDPQPIKNVCVIGGCNGEICTEASQNPVVSVCRWLEEYACYQTAICEVQANGRCGWTQTEILRQCLDQNHPPIIPITPTNPPPNNPLPQPTFIPTLRPSSTSLPLLTPSPTSTFTSRPLPSPTSHNVIFPQPTPTSTSPRVICNIACPDTFTLTSDCRCLPPEPPTTIVDNGLISPPVLTTTTLPHAVRHRLYLATVEIRSGIPDSQLSLKAEGLPAGIALKSCTPSIDSFTQRVSRCTLTGTASVNRTYPITFTISDGLGNVAVETRDLVVISSDSWLRSLFSRLPLVRHLFTQ